MVPWVRIGANWSAPDGDGRRTRRVRLKLLPARHRTPRSARGMRPTVLAAYALGHQKHRGSW
eukprot:scaffold47995_cov58-Phaeocystis_antarctica.AAC.3